MRTGILFLFGIVLNLSKALNPILDKYITARWPSSNNFNDANCSWVPLSSGPQYDFYHDVEQCYARNEPRMVSLIHDYWYLSCQNSDLLSFHNMIRKLNMVRSRKRQLVFLGDSVGRQQLIILGCMLDPTIVFDKCLQESEAHYSECYQCQFHIGELTIYTSKVGAIFGTDKCIEAILKDYLSLSASDKKLDADDLIVMNQGLHHQTEAKEYIRLEELTANSMSLYEQAELKLGKRSAPWFVWRETTPQHFPTCNGQFTKDMRGGQQEKAFSCTSNVYPAMLNGTYNGLDLIGPTPCDTGANLRNELTNDVISGYINSSSSEESKIKISYIYDALKSTPNNFHWTGLSSEVKIDCTHYQTHALIFMNQALLSILV